MKATESWHSERLGQTITITRWGEFGSPVLIFPTAGGDSGEIERFGMISALEPMLSAGRLKAYSVDSLNGRAWLTGADPRHASWTQNVYDAVIQDEVVPAILADCRSGWPDLVAAGPSIGAFNALAVLCRHPELFRAAICMSGTYDLSRWLRGHWTDDFYFSSPLHYLPDLGEGPQLERLRSRFVILAHGSGAWEDPAESWRAAGILGEKGIPNRVDDWGPGYPHDWSTWREMLPSYLADLLG